MRTIKKLAFLLALLLSSASSFVSTAQGLYGNYYHDIDSGANIAVAIARNTDSTLLLTGGGGYTAGYRFGGIQLSPDGSQKLNTALQRVPNGHVSHLDFGTLLRQVNGDYITHQCFIVQSTPAKYGSTANASLVRFKPNGDTAWVKLLTDTNVLAQVPNGLAQTPLDSSFVMSGNQFIATGTIEYGFLMFLDSAGNIKRQRTYQHPSYPSNSTGTIANYIRRPAFLPDGRRVLATCGARTFHSATGGDYYKHHPWVLVCDTQGTILKQRVMPQRYGGAGNSPSSGIDRNGGYYLSGSLDSVLDPNGQPESYLNYPPFFMHLDTNLNTERVVWFGDAFHSYLIYTVKQLRSGAFLLIGRTTLPDTPGDAGWLAVVNTDGSVKWSRRYHKSAQWSHQLFDAVENADGSITAVGSGKSDTSSFQTQADIWVLQVDSNGCEGLGVCGESLAVEEPGVVPKASDFKVYPNPTTGNLTLESAQGGEAVLYNLLGVVVWQQTVSAKETIQLPRSLAAGAYLLRFKGKDGNVFQNRLLYKPE